MDNLLEDVKNLRLSDDFIIDHSQAFSTEEINLGNNYEFSSFLKERGLDSKEIIKRADNSVKEYYIQFLILSLTDLSNPSNVRSILYSSINRTTSPIEWLEKVQKMMTSAFEQKKLKSHDYVKLMEIIKGIIEEIRIRAENKALNQKKSEIEMPVDMDDNYYTIRLEDLKKHKSVRLNKKHKEFKSAYIQELKNRLSKELSSSELEPFLRHQLRFIDDKLKWLRHLDILINKSNRQRDEHPKSNDSILMDLIPELIKKTANNQLDHNESYQQKTVFVELDNSTLIKTRFTIDELVLLFDLLNLADFIDTDTITKKRMSHFIAKHFTTLQRPEGVQAGSVRQYMKETGHEAFKLLDDKLIELRKRLKSKEDSIG